MMWMKLKGLQKLMMKKPRMNSCRTAAGSMYHIYPSNLLKIFVHVNMDKILGVHDCKLGRHNMLSFVQS